MIKSKETICSTSDRLGVAVCQPSQALRRSVLYALATLIVLATLSGEVKSAETASTDADGSAAEAEATPVKNSEKESPQRAATVVSITIRGALSEAIAPPGLFGELQQNLRQTIERLDQAKDDDAIEGVILRVRNPQLGRAKVFELRRAIARLRHHGKRVYADLQLAMPADYLIASACDQIVLPETGNLMLPGVRAELTFYKDLFDKLGIHADMLQVGEFKGAAEPYTRSAMSDAFRKQYEIVIDDVFDQMVDTIADDRQIDRARIKHLIDQGLFTAADAKDAGLVDLVAYQDEYEDHLRQALQADSLEIQRNFGRKKVDTNFSGMSGMLKLLELMTGGDSKSRVSRKQKIAVVYAVGAVTSGSSSSDVLGGQTLGSGTIIKALQTAEADDSVAAIVMRIDSPGGSALASDLIWRQIRRCEKPVVASMGDIAASGGYYIAMGCDKIVAAPGTLTGSIGVVGGKIVLGGLLEKTGVNTQVIARGKNAGLFSSADRFSESERDVFRRSMKDIYEQFTTKAAAGRNMDLDRLTSLAGGRIWTGRQAKENGLVDELGTLQEAVQLARNLAGDTSEDEPSLLILPKSRSFFEQLFDPEVELQSAGELRNRVMQSLAPDVWQAYELLHESPLVWLPYKIRID